MSGILYLVAMPIGNRDDITIRALGVLRSVDLVVCEERREGEKMLRSYGIEKPLDSLNEHNEPAATAVMLRHLQAGKNLALVSDCGTPVFSDPGRLLVQKATAAGVKVVPIPGASSLLPALTVSGFSIDQFLFFGWLSPKKDRRRAELRRLREERRTVVLMDTPYRLHPLLLDLAETFGDSRRLCVAFNLTLPDERVFHGTAAGLRARMGKTELKGEFVIIIEGRDQTTARAENPRQR